MAHSLVTKSQANNQTGAPITFNHTPAAAATLCILSIVVDQAGGARAGGAPTIGGVTALQVDTLRTAVETNVEMWYVAKDFAASTAIAISIPNTGTAKTCHCEVITADAGAGFSSALNNGNGTVTASNADGGQVDVTSSAVGDFLYARLGSGEAAVGSNTQTSTNPTKTLTYENDHGAYTSRGDYGISDGAGTESFIYVWSNDDGAIVAGAWKSVPGSASLSPSESLSQSASLSASPSISPSASLSPSASFSPSKSASPSLSPSASASPSLAVPQGTICWGHITGVLEDNTKTFASDWSGTGSITGSGDSETIELDFGEWMISQVIETGAKDLLISNNYYISGDTPTIYYRTSATRVGCETAGWTVHSSGFTSLGFVQILLTNEGTVTHIKDEFTGADDTELSAHTISPTNVPAASWSNEDTEAYILSNKATRHLVGSTSTNYINPGLTTYVLSYVFTPGSQANNFLLSFAFRYQDTNNWIAFGLTQTGAYLEVKNGGSTTYPLGWNFAWSNQTYTLKAFVTSTSITIFLMGYEGRIMFYETTFLNTATNLRLNAGALVSGETFAFDDFTIKDA